MLADLARGARASARLRGMSRSRLALLAPLTSLVLALSACSGGGADDSVEDAAGGPSSSASASSAPEGDGDSGGSGGGGGEWSALVSRTFVEACEGSAREAIGAQLGEEAVVQYCGCALEGVQQRFSEEEFAEYERGLTAGNPDPASQAQVDEVVDQCNEEING